MFDKLPHNLVFPSPQKVIQDVRPSEYLSSMTRSDMIARQVTDIDPTNYHEKYLGAIREFSDEEKAALAKAVERANAILTRYRRISSIPWKLVKLCCSTEQGMPHTLKDYIFLSQGLFTIQFDLLVSILIHEKVHVFQRLFPIETYVLVHRVWRYGIFDIMEKHEDRRANPDLNNIIYSTSIHGPGFFMGYNSDTPRSLNDATVRTTDSNLAKQKYEHPFERMAYEIADGLCAKPHPKLDTALDNWMQTHF